MLSDLEAIQKHCELEYTPVFKRVLNGGDINEVFLIESNHSLWVVKKNNKDRFPGMLEKESKALKFYLEKTSAFYPKPIHNFSEGEYQYLLLDYVEQGESTETGQRRLGVELGKQHLVSLENFGWSEDNYIGSFPQRNEYKDNWAEFYASQRILPQTKRAFDGNIVDRSFVQKIDCYCSHLENIFPIENPSLLHGDLWGGNYFITKNEEPFFYDPAVYFGHREMDIAMTFLFGGFSEEFYRSYDETFQLEKGWKERVPHGQLYPNLVHLNLFGPAYLGAITKVLDKF